MMAFTELLPVLSLISISSSLLPPDKSGILLCKSKCKSNSGCTSVRFDSKHLHCELIFGTNSTRDTDGRGIRLFKVQSKTSIHGCGRKERIVYNRHGSPKCVKVGPKPSCRKVKRSENPCRGAATVKANDKRSRCILYREENITVNTDYEIALPVIVNPGMKLVVYGESVKGAKFTHFFIRDDPEKFYCYSHIAIDWNKRMVIFVGTHTPTPKAYIGQFPVSDKAHFTLTVELTQSLTKIYADMVLVQTVGQRCPIRNFNLNMYSRVHVFVVQKTGEECENVNTGIP